MFSESYKREVLSETVKILRNEYLKMRKALGFGPNSQVSGTVKVWYWGENTGSPYTICLEIVGAKKKHLISIDNAGRTEQVAIAKAQSVLEDIANWHNNCRLK